jgi:hypothetical protein
MNTLKLLAVIFLLTPTLTWACPNLAGDFLCTENGEQSPLTITQTTENGVTIYNDGSEKYYADNKSHPVNWDFLVGTYKARCVGNEFVLKIDGEIIYEGEKYGDVDDVSNLSMADANTLHINYKSKTTDPDGQVDEASGLMVCERQ